MQRDNMRDRTTNVPISLTLATVSLMSVPVCRAQQGWPFANKRLLTNFKSASAPEKHRQSGI